MPPLTNFVMVIGSCCRAVEYRRLVCRSETFEFLLLNSLVEGTAYLHIYAFWYNINVITPAP